MNRFFSVFLCLCAFTCLSLKAEEKTDIIVCDNGLEMFAWDLEFIRHATQSIDISACFFGGTIARELLTEIEARLEVCPDIQVRILATPILLERADYVIINRLQEKYPLHFHLEHATNVTVVWPDVTGIDNHVKLCVIDERYFSMGGTNLDESQCSDGTFTPNRNNNKLNMIAANLPAGMRDQDIVGRGPIAKQIRETFCKIFSLWNHYNTTKRLERNPEVFADNSYYFPVTAQPFVERFETSEQLIPLEQGQMKYLLCGPHQKTNVITQEYVRLIQEAKKEIKIANLYVAPAKPIFDALLAAVNRGIKLTIISNGVGKNTPEYTRFFGWANRMSYIPLLHGQHFHFWDYWSVKSKEPKNTHIYEYDVKDVLLHKKLMIIDDHSFVVGSYNLGLKSDLSDYETVMVIQSPEAVVAINEVFARDLAHSRLVTPEEACGWYFDPGTSYLGELQRRFHGLL
ncbi:MAG: Cardiolipin synthase [Chlamydiales bacterium]|nr:Cardiolipin synthase [Chlamydiales bacterium]